MDQNSLSGELPSSLQNSSSLSTIDVSNNSLDGMLFFPNANNLTQLYASKNAFTYLNIDVNTALQKIVLDDNLFNCTLPNAGAFGSLQTFSVARNKFSGHPFNVTYTKELAKLYVIPTAVLRHYTTDKLIYLHSDLSHNFLTGSFPDVTQLSLLTYLALGGNSLSGPFPDGPAPSSLTVCHLDPILTSDCPPTTVMNDPESLAGRCELKCRGGGKPVNAVDGSQQSSSSSPSSNAGDSNASASGVTAKARGKTSAALGTAAGQQGSTVLGNDEGETPASLSAADSSDATALRFVFRKQGRLASCGGFVWPLIVVLSSSLWVIV